MDAFPAWARDASETLRAHEVDASAAARAWAENPLIRRMLGPPRVLKPVKDISESEGEAAAGTAAA